MNNYKYRTSNILFDARLNHLANSIKKEFNDKSITQTDYAYKLKNEIVAFYNSLGKPSFKQYLAYTVPSLTLHNNMLTCAKNDMEMIINGCVSINDNIDKLYETINDTNIFFENRINTTEIAISTTIDKLSNKNIFDASLFSDIFSLTENEYGNIETSESSFLTLEVTKKTLTTSDFTCSILNTSNGFPGNTHEVYQSIVNDGYKNVKFKGENNVSINVNEVLKTSNDKWFEFEMFTLENDLEEETSKIGFSYKENISWIGEDKCLYLDIELRAKTKNVYSNFIKISSILKKNINVNGYILKNAIIYDGDVLINNINVNEEVKDELIVSFKTQKIETIVLKFEQKNNFITNVCREYTTDLEVGSNPYIFNNSQNYNENKLEVPVDYRKSIYTLGMKYDQKTGVILYSDEESESFINDTYIKNNLFFNTGSDEHCVVKRDIVPVTKYCIGIKNIEIRKKEYLKESTYISRLFSCSNIIKTLTLEADDYIPYEFEKTEGSYIKYSISFNSDSTWYEINPRHRLGNPCTIVINSNSIVANRDNNKFKYIELLNDPTSFNIKIELSRPDDINDLTPIIYKYNTIVGYEEVF